MYFAPSQTRYYKGKAATRAALEKMLGDPAGIYRGTHFQYLMELVTQCATWNYRAYRQYPRLSPDCSIKIVTFR